MSLGENIYRLRSEKNWSQTDLADALEVSRQSVSKWENDTATPDLERLIKMKELFDISLDELVFGEVSGKKEEKKESEKFVVAVPSRRVLAGIAMLIFGMIFFLLSIFWGDHIAFGESFGELFSAVVVLISIAMICPYDFRVFTVCTIIFFVYSVICFGFLHINNNINSIFTFIASVVIVVWFIICGEHNSKIEKAKDKREEI